MDQKLFFSFRKIITWLRLIKNSNIGFQMVLNSGFSVNVIMAVRPFNTDVMAGDQFVPVYSPPGRRSSRPAAGPAVPSRCSPSASG